MEYVLTTSSSVKCDHGGPITLKPTQNVLKIQRSSVLDSVLVGDLTGSEITGCNQTSTNSTQCNKVINQSGGKSKVLKVDGSPVLLKSSSGLTNGSPGNTWSAKDSGHTVLRAD